MRFIHKLLVLFFFSLIAFSTEAKTVYDSPQGGIKELFNAGKAKYIIRYAHQFRDTLRVPLNSEIHFKGGQLSGVLIFQETKLTGDVNLKGSSISGSVKNHKFNASWICSMDGEMDDARKINEMISVCKNIFFPKGRYRLITPFISKNKVPENNEGSVFSHIGIYRDGICLEGEEGTIFVTREPISMVCVFSQPYQIGNSIRNISIKNIEFDVINTGKEFAQFVHTIKVVGVNGLSIANCRFNDFWGDAISLSHYGDTPETGERTRNQNVKILNNDILGGPLHNNRNGISIGNGKNVLIRGNIIKNTSRDDMPGGIDVEPNNTAYTVEDIRIENNVFEGIKGMCGAITIIFNRGATGKNISIVGNSIRDCNKGIEVFVNTNNTTRNFIIKNNSVALDTKPYFFNGGGSSVNWKILYNTFQQYCSQPIPGKIKVKKLTVRGNRLSEVLMEKISTN